MTQIWRQQALWVLPRECPYAPRLCLPPIRLALRKTSQVSQTISPDWPQTKTFLIPVSQVARIIGVNHWHPANPPISKVMLYGKLRLPTIFP
jgi:hypothetical protein